MSTNLAQQETYQQRVNRWAKTRNWCPSEGSILIMDSSGKTYPLENTSTESDIKKDK